MSEEKVKGFLVLKSFTGSVKEDFTAENVFSFVLTRQEGNALLKLHGWEKGVLAKTDIFLPKEVIQ